MLCLIIQLLISDRTSLYSCRYSLLFVSQGKYTLKTYKCIDPQNQVMPKVTRDSLIFPGWPLKTYRSSVLDPSRMSHHLSRADRRAVAHQCPRESYPLLGWGSTDRHLTVLA